MSPIAGTISQFHETVHVMGGNNFKFYFIAFA
jgi:hypothetical protein